MKSNLMIAGCLALACYGVLSAGCSVRVDSNPPPARQGIDIDVDRGPRGVDVDVDVKPKP